MTLSSAECWQETVSGPGSEQVAEDRERLRHLLKTQGILRANAEQPISGRDGARAPWMFYSWNCSLTPEGAVLAGRCLLAALRSFRSTQLASFGYTGVPLLMSCVLSDRSNYTGLVIREVRKQHGSSRQIEGPADRSRPVVVIDDSLSSGTSLRRAIQALEEEGFRVEGAVALVNFPFRGGLEWAESLGYHVEAIFDAWEDLGAPRPTFIAGHRRFNEQLWAKEAIEDNLHPATAARRTAEFYLSRGLMPRPPARFDAEYDGRGGVYVSFRERESENRLARDGFWHFDPADADPQRDIVLATVKTLQAGLGKISLQNLADLKINASFFGPLEKITPSKLDFSRYGIVARSRGWDTKMGGALPNSQVFTSELEQYHHARWSNAKIPPSEPHDLFRHEINKCVEPGEYWLPFGTYQDPNTHWSGDESIGKRLTERALDALRAAAKGTEPDGEPLLDNLIPAPVDAVAVTLYRGGVDGCYVTWGGTLDSCIVRAAAKAFSDRRFAGRPKDGAMDDIGVAVSILHDREWVGEATVERAALKLRPGADSMAVQQGARRGFLLASVAPHFNWSKEQFAKELLRKAGIERPPYTWSTYHTATWLRTPQATYKIKSGFPERKAPEPTRGRLESDAALLAGYILRQFTPNGLPAYSYLPLTGQTAPQGSPAGIVHALGALETAGRLLQLPALREPALLGLKRCLGSVVKSNGKPTLYLAGQQPSAMADCQLLAATIAVGLPAGIPDALAARVRSMFQPDGRITDTPTGLGVASEHDFLPGAALLAVARHAARAADHSWLDRLAPQLNWYRHRFRFQHSWGMVGWQTRGWAAVHELTKDPEQAEFVFELADWALDWQHERTGAFICDLFPSGPSFHTAFLAEGIAAAWKVALRTGDAERAARYEHSCLESLRFMNTLIVYPEDTFCMRDPARAVGGVRCSLTTSSVRIDFVSHTLFALLETLESMSAGKGTAA